MVFVYPYLPAGLKNHQAGCTVTAVLSGPNGLRPRAYPSTNTCGRDACLASGGTGVESSPFFNTLQRSPKNTLCPRSKSFSGSAVGPLVPAGVPSWGWPHPSTPPPAVLLAAVEPRHQEMYYCLICVRPRKVLPSPLAGLLHPLAIP